MDRIPCILTTIVTAWQNSDGDTTANWIKRYEAGPCPIPVSRITLSKQLNIDEAAHYFSSRNRAWSPATSLDLALCRSYGGSKEENTRSVDSDEGDSASNSFY